MRRTTEQKERHRIAEAKRRATNPDKMREIERNRYAKNLVRERERRRLASAKKRAENPARELKRGQDWRAKNPNKWREYVLRYLYGLPIEKFEEMKVAQNNQCAICQKLRPLAVDHCHRTGKVRELLCKKCNLALGYIEDNAESAAAMVCYLEKHN